MSIGQHEQLVQELMTASQLVFELMTKDHSGDWGMDINEWDWVPGTGIIAIEDYGRRTGNETALQYVHNWVEHNKDKAGKVKVINSMAPFAVFPELYRRTQEEQYLQKAGEIARWMLYEAPRTREGAFEHTVTENASFKEQVWADTIFMAVLFLARYARLTENKEIAAEALEQTMLHLRLLQDNQTGALFHGWNCEAGNHMSAVRWTRANAWITLATPEIATELQGLVEIPQELNERYQRLAKALLQEQQTDGLWHTVLDRKDFMKETSGSAGIACGFIRAHKLGWLDQTYCEAALRTVNGVMSLIDQTGAVAGVSGGTPVMPTVDAYNGIPVYPTLYGQGLVLMLLTSVIAAQSER